MLSYRRLPRLAITLARVSIANSDADENPYTLPFRIWVRLVQALQTITFNPLPVRCLLIPTYPGATSSAGLPITYSSSNTAVANIVGQQID
jgi:hypothetical protein